MVDNLIAEALDLHVLDLEEERAPDGKWHPSQLWQCARMNVLAVRGVIATSPPDAQAKRVFRLGHMYHSLVQAALPGHPRIVAAYPEFGIDVPEWNIVGHGDDLIELDNGDFWVVEVKSTKSLRYTPKEDHEKQASVYFSAARDFGWYDSELPELLGDPEIIVYREPLGDKLKGILLAYLNKTDLEIKEYIYPYDPKWRPAIEARVKELDYFRLEDNNPLHLPAPLQLDKGKPSWYLRYCNYRGSGFCCADDEEDEW